MPAIEGRATSTFRVASVEHRQRTHRASGEARDDHCGEGDRPDPRSPSAACPEACRRARAWNGNRGRLA